ncbi:protein involved in gliding motility EpsA [Lutibacter agarilyticus]|uniref:Protein involved in gliding motility EpsA n=1 Tax=Lutibacter agarilyticus TaxID=1109740 RepID=A0A238WWV4_9FLAO|nr:polysaccharide biosynthesis/export family protein [Lutibacter agarilyticus]SNR50079.1 protein involved in gliding motility EpsA [Lutibacter agarilyticus]
MKKFFLYAFVLCFLSSCIPAKKLTYFQGEPATKSELYRLNNEPYRLQVNDILYIDIKAENPEIVSLFKNSATTSTTQGGEGLYFTGYTIDRHGNIRIPYIGDLNVLGYTEKEVRQKIESELTKYVKKVESVFVTVKLAGINFVITGEVGSPGTINLSQNEVSIVDAIANAGDVNTFGDRENIVVVRKTIDGVKKYKVNLLEIEIFESDNFYIKPNDVIYVAPLKQKTWGFGATGFQTFTTLVTVFSFVTTTILLINTL